MDRLLAPGMRLIRRLGVTGKFGTIGLVLLVPLLVTSFAGWSASSGEITSTGRQRQGLLLTVPLVRLAAALADQQSGPDLGAPRPSSAVRDAIEAVDAADAAVEARIGLRSGWQHLRADLLTGDPQPAVTGGRPSPGATTDGDGSGVAAARATRLQGQLQATGTFLERVAGASGLILDPQLDSYYVMIALVDRLPGVLTTVVADEQQARSRAGPLTREETRPLALVIQRLRLDLGTAGSSTGWDGLAAEYGSAAATLSAALQQYLAGLVSASSPARDLTTVTAAAAALAGTLGSALDTLLAHRQQELAALRLRPALLAGLALACGAYLALALYRTTSRDVRALLADINAVTSGDLQTGEPLGGRDELAQMSRAVRATNDRLTELLSALRMQATHDDLTALPNRQMFMAKLADALAEHPGDVAVVLADLERFKDVNDSFGHDIGDRLLRTVGARFHRAAGRRNLVARLGGDEFAVLVQDAPGMLAVRQVIARMQVALAEPVDVDGRQLHVRARMGVALHATGRPGALELFRNADVALSAAKNGSGGVSVFEPAMHDRTRDRTELSADLVTAVARQQFSLVYQPMVDVGTGLVKGVEALARWDHPTRGQISPAVFVPLAEASGQIVPLGRWVLHEALQQLAAWHREFPDGYPLTLDVNLSADQLADPGLPGEVLALVDQTGVDPRRLVLEITESALIRDTETVLRRLRRLSVIGIRLALDDFGTGYSSLSYLRRMPVSVLKIDKSFVDGIEAPDGQAARLLRDIVGLGAGLGMEVIAEGIEVPGQVPVLRRAGCHLGQGFLWARPMVGAAVGELLRRGGRIELDRDGVPPGAVPATGTAPPAVAVPRTGPPAERAPGAPAPGGVPRPRGDLAAEETPG